MDDALPLPDYDQMSDKTLEHRIRSLDQDQLQTLLEYERAHAGRPAVELLLTNRLRQLADGAEPSPGGETETLETSDPARGGSPVHPDTSPEPMHQPPHGTPYQPGKGPRMGP